MLQMITQDLLRNRRVRRHIDSMKCTSGKIWMGHVVTGCINLPQRYSTLSYILNNVKNGKNTYPVLLQFSTRFTWVIKIYLLAIIIGLRNTVRNEKNKSEIFTDTLIKERIREKKISNLRKISVKKEEMKKKKDWKASDNTTWSRSRGNDTQGFIWGMRSSLSCEQWVRCTAYY